MTMTNLVVIKHKRISLSQSKTLINCINIVDLNLIRRSKKIQCNKCAIFSVDISLKY